MLVCGRGGTATERATAMAEAGLLGRTIPEAGMGRKGCRDGGWEEHEKMWPKRPSL